MEDNRLQEYFIQALTHRDDHTCGGYPYEHCGKIVDLIQENGYSLILEIGTGIGYSAAYIASQTNATIHTIDQDSSHLHLAKNYWEELGVQERIVRFEGKAESILPALTDSYDLIFFDGYVPQMKMLLQFERLLRKNGTLVTANLFLRDLRGGKYLRALHDITKWKTSVFADTAFSQKVL